MSVPNARDLEVANELADALIDKGACGALARSEQVIVRKATAALAAPIIARYRAELEKPLPPPSFRA